MNIGGKKIYVIANVVIVCMLVTLGGICFFGGESYAVVGQNSAKPYYKGNTNSQNVSLMINVYWGDEYLDGILKNLKKFNVKCTFFVGGTWANKNKTMLQRMVDEGHEIGNHGFFHKDHKGLSKEENIKEIKNTNDLVKNLIGYDITLFAPPSGSFDKTTLAVAEELQMKVIMWSKDTVDWRDKDESIVFKRATNKISGGDLILMHPTAHTLKALPKILQYYKDNGLCQVSVSEIIKIATLTILQ